MKELLNHSNKIKKLKAFSLVELIIAIGVFSLAISSFAFLGIEAYKTLRTSQNRITASKQIKEISDLIMLVKNESWANIVDNTQTGAKHILNTNGVLTIEDGEIEENGITYYFVIKKGYRDENGILIEIEDEDFEDISTRIIDLTIIFNNNFFGTDEYNAKIYINNWNTSKLTQSTTEDFEEGANEGTDILEDGAVELTKRSLTDFPDWCRPQFTHSVLTIDPRSKSVKTHLDNVYVVRGESSSDPLFGHVKIIPPVAQEPPSLLRVGEFSPSKGTNKTNNLHFDNNYIYTANPNEAFESVWIIDVNQEKANYSPEVGWYRISGKPNTSTIYTSGNYGFVGYLNKIDVFDISQKTGARSRISTVTIGGTSAKVKDKVVIGNYIFVAMTDHTSLLVIVDISNINNPQILGQFPSANNLGNAIFVSSDTNTAYVGTLVSATEPEFFVIDTTNKSAPSLIGSFDTSGMHIADLTIVSNRAVLGGYGTNNYIVLKLDNLENPDKCGELLINGNVVSLDVATYQDRLFTYVLARQGTNSELQIIEGGAGLVPGPGDDYINYGEYFSKIFDSNSTSTRFYSIHAYGTEPQGTSLKIWFKVGNQPDLSDGVWIGPDGTADTFFALGDNEITNTNIKGRYFQYRLEMASDDLEKSPVLDKIEIIYD